MPMKQKFFKAKIEIFVYTVSLSVEVPHRQTNFSTPNSRMAIFTLLIKNNSISVLYIRTYSWNAYQRTCIKISAVRVLLNFMILCHKSDTSSFQIDHNVHPTVSLLQVSYKITRSYIMFIYLSVSLHIYI